MEIRGWRWVSTGRMERFTQAAERPGAGQVLVQVAGCGVCHTDVGFFSGEVPPRRSPVVLGHEIAGTVVDAAEDARALVGKMVLVPAVWPCGECAACRRGRPTACAHSRMPGNDLDGGFATHLYAPARWLCAVESLKGHELWQLSVIADAVSTPLQAIRRAGLQAGELAVIVGAGGVGIFAVQLARALGATVAAIDVDGARLELAARLGAHLTLDVARGAKPIKAALKELAQARGLAADGWRIFELSGHPSGQELAWSLITRGGSLSVVGYTAEPSRLRLSNLMALDATAFGNWGCDPALYPEALARVLAGEVQVRPVVRSEPLDEAPRVLAAVQRHEFRERVVLVP